eukprot:1383747-Rhodomonas_salina.1
MCYVSAGHDIAQRRQIGRMLQPPPSSSSPLVARNTMSGPHIACSAKLHPKKGTGEALPAAFFLASFSFLRAA